MNALTPSQRIAAYATADLPVTLQPAEVRELAREVRAARLLQERLGQLDRDMLVRRVEIAEATAGEKAARADVLEAERRALMAMALSYAVLLSMVPS